MSELDPKAWLADAPLDPDDVPRYVHLERIINGHKRRQWLWDLAKKAPIGAAIVLVGWQIVHVIAERFPQP